MVKLKYSQISFSAELKHVETNIFILKSKITFLDIYIELTRLSIRKTKNSIIIMYH